mgnify:CR=1 FL=1
MTDKAVQYESWDPNAETRAEVAELRLNGKTAELEAILGTRLQFGTAGLRGPMGPGYNRMNELVVLQTCQGLIRYIESLDSGAKAKVFFGALFLTVLTDYSHFSVLGCCHWLRPPRIRNFIFQEFCQNQCCSIP